MRGTLSFMKPEPTWKNFFGYHKFATVTIDGTPGYRLVHKPYLLSRSDDYTLYGPDGNMLEIWSSATSRISDLITITESPKLQYQCGRDYSLARFITDTENIDAILTTSTSSRSFKLQDMEFKHKDYDSHIHFRAPDHKTHQAIIIANLLFNPKYTSNG